MTAFPTCCNDRVVPPRDPAAGIPSTPHEDRPRPPERPCRIRFVVGGSLDLFAAQSPELHTEVVQLRDLSTKVLSDGEYARDLTSRHLRVQSIGDQYVDGLDGW